MQIHFPSSFLWGAALSSYQAEGGNSNCDWALWEKERGLEQSLKACDHYNRYKEDFSLAKELNLGAIRFSIEWARCWRTASDCDESSYKHYHSVIKTLHSFGIKPIVTLHHFTNPTWFINRGGWEKPSNVDLFLKYLSHTVRLFRSEVDTWLILNEPSVYLYNGYISGIWPPGEKSISTAKKVLANMMSAYSTGFQEIKHIYRNSKTKVQVSLAKNLRHFVPAPKGIRLLNGVSASVRSHIFNYSILDSLAKKRQMDFLGINYYCREYDQFKGLLGKELTDVEGGGRKNYLGWYVDERSFYKLLKSLKRYRLPIIITENGTAEGDEQYYEDYLMSHLTSLAQAINDHVDIRGYLWWSLLDNFEWDKGFGPRFGLIHVDYQTMQRKIRDFAYKYAKIARENTLEMFE